MKKLILLLIVVILAGCEHPNIETAIESNDHEIVLESGTTDFETEYDEYCQYLEDQNDIHSGALYNYMANNPGFTASDLDNLGYASESVLEAHKDDYEAEAKLVADEDEVQAAALTIEGNHGMSGFVILNCSGCINGVPGDHCWTALSTWSWGPGC